MREKGFFEDRLFRSLKGFNPINELEAEGAEGIEVLPGWIVGGCKMVFHDVSD